MFFYTKEQKALNATSGEKEVTCSTFAFEEIEDAEKQLYYDAWYAIDQKANFDFFIGVISNELGNNEKLIRKDWRVTPEPTPPEPTDENESPEDGEEQEE